MEDQKRLLLALGLIAVVVVAMTLLWPAQQRPEGERPAPQTTTASAEEPDGSAEAEEEEGEAEGEGEAEAPAEGESEPAEREREIRPEKRLRLKTARLEVEISTHGGGLTEATLLDEQFQEGRGDKARQIDLVSVDLDDRPELMPIAFNLVRRRESAPAASGSAEGQGVLRLLNHGSVNAERLATLAELGDGVASKLAGGRPYASLEDASKALGGSKRSRERIFAKLLGAAWSAGFVRLDFEVVSEDEDRVVLRGTTDDRIEVVRAIDLASDFELRIVDQIRNRGKGRVEVRERLTATGLEIQSGGGFLFGRPTGLVKGICLHGDDIIRRDRGRLAGDSGGCMGFTGCGGPPGPASMTGHIRFVAVDQHFFMVALTPGASWSDTTCNLRGESDNTIQVEIEGSVFTELEPGARTTYASTAYLGPKQFELLSEVGPGRRLWEAIDYGWFAFLSHWLLRGLRLFHGWFGNWGLAVIFLTFLIKLVLLPVTHKTFMNMREMQRDMAQLKPELDKINERYKDQADVKQQKTMELYNAHGINPLKQVSGCLPMFLQMPIWIALYRMISESVELYRAPFYWWLDDLSAQDPYYILPGLLGLSMFIQQRITPQPGVDNAQARMMKWMMPGMFLLIMLNMPSGLVLYIFVNTLLTLVQQQFINRMVPADGPSGGKGKGKDKAADGSKPATSGDDDGGSSADSPRPRRKSKSRRRKRK